MRGRAAAVWMAVARVAVTVAAVASVSCAARGLPAAAPTAPTVTSEGVRFVMEHRTAQSVALAGSFNQWSASSHPFARLAPAGPWTLTVALPPGDHLFMYVVDGTAWVSPPFAEDYVDDGFGAKNGVVVVRPVER